MALLSTGPQSLFFHKSNLSLTNCMVRYSACASLSPTRTLIEQSHFLIILITPVFVKIYAVRNMVSTFPIYKKQYLFYSHSEYRGLSFHSLAAQFPGDRRSRTWPLCSSHVPHPTPAVDPGWSRWGGRSVESRLDGLGTGSPPHSAPECS